MLLQNLGVTGYVSSCIHLSEVAKRQLSVRVSLYVVFDLIDVFLLEGVHLNKIDITME